MFKLLDSDTTVYFIFTLVKLMMGSSLVSLSQPNAINCEAFSQTALDGSSIFYQEPSFSVPVITKKKSIT